MARGRAGKLLGGAGRGLGGKKRGVGGEGGALGVVLRSRSGWGVGRIRQRGAGGRQSSSWRAEGKGGRNVALWEKGSYMVLAAGCLLKVGKGLEMGGGGGCSSDRIVFNSWIQHFCGYDRY